MQTSLDTQPPARRDRTPEPEYESAANGMEITPELALVTPELARAARAELPDRPWEAFSIRVPPGSEERRHHGSAQDPTAMLRAHARSASSLRRRTSSLVAAALLASLAGLWLLAGSPERPTASGVEQLPSPTATTATTATTSEAAGPATATSLLAPHGGYVVAPRGSLTVGALGRTIERFELPVRCGANTPVLEGIPVLTRSFEFVGTAGPEDVTIRIRGRVLGPMRIRGVVEHDSRRCSPRRVTFTARLS